MAANNLYDKYIEHFTGIKNVLLYSLAMYVKDRAYADSSLTSAHKCSGLSAILDTAVDGECRTSTTLQTEVRHE